MKLSFIDINYFLTPFSATRLSVLYPTINDVIDIKFYNFLSNSEYHSAKRTTLCIYFGVKILQRVVCDMQENLEA